MSVTLTLDTLSMHRVRNDGEGAEMESTLKSLVVKWVLVVGLGLLWEALKYNSHT